MSDPTAAYVTAVLSREQVQMLLDSIDLDTCFPENRPMMEDASERLHAALNAPIANVVEGSDDCPTCIGERTVKVSLPNGRAVIVTCGDCGALNAPSKGTDDA